MIDPSRMSGVTHCNCVALEATIHLAYERIQLGSQRSRRCRMPGRLVRMSLALTLSLAAVVMLSCGGSSNRVLQSISVSPQAANGQVQYVATGVFSSPPVNVTPLPVNWCLQNPQSASSGVCSPGISSEITSQGFASCGALTISMTVIAMAPADPKLPLNSQGVPIVSGTATLGCP
jgi:hypothetical protein